MADCYIYYRIDPVREAEARRALDAMLTALRAASGIVGRVYQKTHEPLLWTWRDTYDPLVVHRP